MKKDSVDPQLVLKILGLITFLFVAVLAGLVGFLQGTPPPPVPPLQELNTK